MGSLSLHFGLVDVFAREPLTGNGLSIFLLEHELPSELMQHITQEIRQFESLLAEVGAKFVYVLDVFKKEGRTRDNNGKVEDIANGCAAGPAAAYLVKNGPAQVDEIIQIKQGRFVGRPGELLARVRKDSSFMVTVKGQVCFVGGGFIELPNQGMPYASR